MKLLRAAVIGVGYLGEFHAQKYHAIPDVELVGVFDTNPTRADEIAKLYDTKAFSDFYQLLQQVDIATIAVPTECHYQVASDCLAAGVHVLLEKPITRTLEEARSLIDLANKHNLVFQVGHLERFNPAIRAIQGEVKDPHFIEVHRLAPFNLRSTDIDVVLDLMIHDIDIILSLVKSPVVDIRSVGVPVITDSTDIANARLEFKNGCVANLTASRVSNKSMRKARIFQQNTYLSIDFFGRTISLHHVNSVQVGEPPKIDISVEDRSFGDSDALYDEISAFIEAIREKHEPVVTGQDAMRALEVALLISEKIKQTSPKSLITSKSPPTSL